MTKYAMLLGSMLLFSAGAHAQPVPWTLDTNHSEIGFTARHLGFSKVHGQFKTFTATIEADQKTGKITKLEAEADAKSVDTGVQKRDDDLRSDNFFNAAQYPKLKLALKSIKWKGNAFTAIVALTIRDVTKDVKFEGALLGAKPINFGNGAHMRAAYEAHAKINRQDFHLKFNALAEGVSVVGDDVEIDLTVEMSAPIAAAAAPAAAPAK
jgi:polyisoprenoid-binding protein YceI